MTRSTALNANALQLSSIVRTRILGEKSHMENHCVQQEIAAFCCSGKTWQVYTRLYCTLVPKQMISWHIMSMIFELSHVPIRMAFASTSCKVHYHQMMCILFCYGIRAQWFNTKFVQDDVTASQLLARW